jgi:hypothetical protein
MTSVKLKTAMVFFFAGAGVACALFNIPRDFGPIGMDIVHLTQIAAMASPVLFLIAGVRLFYNPRSGDILGLVAGVVALPWFVWLERVFHRNMTNSWIQLNLSDSGRP